MQLIDPPDVVCINSVLLEGEITRGGMREFVPSSEGDNAEPEASLFQAYLTVSGGSWSGRGMRVPIYSTGERAREMNMLAVPGTRVRILGHLQHRRFERPKMVTQKQESELKEVLSAHGASAVDNLAEHVLRAIGWDKPADDETYEVYVTRLDALPASVSPIGKDLNFVVVQGTVDTFRDFCKDGPGGVDSMRDVKLMSRRPRSNRYGRAWTDHLTVRLRGRKRGSFVGFPEPGDFVTAVGELLADVEPVTLQIDRDRMHELERVFADAGITANADPPAAAVLKVLTERTRTVLRVMARGFSVAPR